MVVPLYAVPVCLIMRCAIHWPEEKPVERPRTGAPRGFRSEELDFVAKLSPFLLFLLKK